MAYAARIVMKITYAPESIVHTIRRTYYQCGENAILIAIAAALPFRMHFIGFC